MPFRELAVEEISISSRISATLPINSVVRGNVSSLIRSWNNLNRPSTSRPRSPSLQNLATTIRGRRASLAARSEFFDGDPITDPPKREDPNPLAPKQESSISTPPKLESYVPALSKRESTTSTSSKRDSTTTTPPKRATSVTNSPERGEKWHGKSWVKQDFVAQNGVDPKGPLISLAETIPADEEEIAADQPMATDLWSPLIEEDGRTGLRWRQPPEQRRCLPETWYRSPQRDEDGSSSASTSNAHLEKLKAIGRKHGLDFEPVEENPDYPIQREQLQHKIHRRNHRQCHRCGEIYDFYNICLRCGHKCCRECPRSPSERLDEEIWMTTGSCSAQDERKSSSLLPMTHNASSYAESASHDDGDDAGDEPAYIEALIEDIDNAITTACGGYEGVQREGSTGEESEDTATNSEVNQKQITPPGGFPDSPNESHDVSHLHEMDIQIQALGYGEMIATPEEDFLSPDDLSFTKEINGSSRSSTSISLSPPPRSSRSSCCSVSHSSLTACSEQNRGRTYDRIHSHTKQKPQHHHHAVPHHRCQPCCHCCSPNVADPCYCYHERPTPTIYCGGSSRSSSRCSQTTSAIRTCDHHDEASSDWGHCSQATQQQSCRCQRQRRRVHCIRCPNHCEEGRSRHRSPHRHHRSRASSTPFILALHLTNQFLSPQALSVQPLATPVLDTAPQPPPGGPSSRWSVSTHSLRKPEHGEDDGPAADMSQSRLWRMQQPAPGKVSDHQQHSQSLPVTRKATEMIGFNTRKESVAGAPAGQPPREAIKQGSVAARARAWEQNAAAVVGIPPLPSGGDKGKKGEQESRRNSGDSLVDRLGIKGQKIDNGGDQAGASLHKDGQEPETTTNRVKIIVEVLGDGDMNILEEGEQLRRRRGNGRSERWRLAWIDDEFRLL